MKLGCFPLIHKEHEERPSVVHGFPSLSPYGLNGRNATLKCAKTGVVAQTDRSLARCLDLRTVEEETATTEDKQIEVLVAHLITAARTETREGMCVSPANRRRFGRG